MPGTIIKLEGGHSVHLKNKNAVEALADIRRAQRGKERWQWFDGPEGQPNAVCIDSFAAVAVINDGRGV